MSAARNVTRDKRRAVDASRAKPSRSIAGGGQSAGAHRGRRIARAARTARNTLPVIVAGCAHRQVVLAGGRRARGGRCGAERGELVPAHLEVRAGSTGVTATLAGRGEAAIAAESTPFATPLPSKRRRHHGSLSFRRLAELASRFGIRSAQRLAGRTRHPAGTVCVRRRLEHEPETKFDEPVMRVG